MTIYSLYIFDRCVYIYSYNGSGLKIRHCDCVYYQDWHRSSPLRAPAPSRFRPNVHRIQSQGQAGAPARQSIFDQPDPSLTQPPVPPSSKSKGLPFDEEAKLVYGVVLSLRNMVTKLSGKTDESFLSYRTPTYRLHLFETLTGYRFVLLSDPASESLRFVLRQLYQGPFVEYVARNPLVDMDSRTTGIDNDNFRAAVDKHMRSLTVFA